MAEHQDLTEEQAYVDHAYRCLERARESALGLRRLTSVGRGGTHQNRYESDVIEDAIRARLAALEIGDSALLFGRIDTVAGGDQGDGVGGDRWYIGRIAVADEHQEPVVVDWRAPVAEPFYRATGRSPMGLVSRRHFATRGRTLLAIEEEVFGEGGSPDGLVGRGALVAALERSRSGYLGDIVATIQAEQDEIIRDELAGVLVVQGGPGTGKTVVALHRAAYLLYTHRFPLEGQGVLVVGPNRLFLRYIERVLPSLGEAGVELATVGDLVPEPVGEAVDPPVAARVKGDARMSAVLARAVRDRQRPLRDDVSVGFGLTSLRLTVEASERIVRAARRRARLHNAGRRIVEQLVWEELAATARRRPGADGDGAEPTEVRDRLRRTPEVRAALEWMWPLLSPADLLRDLFGSAALVRLAARRDLTADEQASLHRERGESVDDVAWTAADAALLDEARALLGPRVAASRALLSSRGGDEEEEPRTYGHIVVDEAQDLSPMQLRMLRRRSLNGSMTVVGDVAQATGSWAPSAWGDVLGHLPNRRPARLRELTIGYRTPAQIMELAGRVLAHAAPGLRLPRSVREGDAPPVLVEVAVAERAARVAALAASELVEVGDGNVAVIVPDSLLEEVADGLRRAGVDHGEAPHSGLDARIILVPVRLVKGLELDSVIVVEPARIVADSPQGLRGLYVALTRSTRRLTLVHAEPLPEVLADPG